MNRSILFRTITISASLCLLALVGCTTQPVNDAMPSATAASPAAAESTPVASDDEKLVCRSYESTGSRLRRERVCMTAREWRNANDDAQDFARGMEKGGSGQAGGESLQGN